MIHRGFEETKIDIKALEEKMTTKEELIETREILARAIKDLEAHLSVSMSHKQEQIDHLRNWMEGIEARVAALEVKQPKKK